MISFFGCGCAGVFLREENDFFTLFNEDRYYSQGLEIGKTTNNVTVGIGNKIYTPNDKWAETLIEDDRPYVGYSYIFANRDGSRYNSLLGADQTRSRIEAGLVGPGAGGESVQNRFHDFIGNARFHGWGNQLRNEPVLNYYHEEIWVNRPLRFGYFRTGIRGGLGNFDTSITGFNRYVIDATIYGVNVEMFAGVESKLKGRDITLDGNTFRDSHRVDSIPVVASATAGFCLKHGNVFFGYVYRQSTKEFAGQEYGHSFGSVLIGYGECR